jgi:hypothetical protein
MNFAGGRSFTCDFDVRLCAEKLTQFLTGKKFIIGNERLDSHRLSHSSDPEICSSNQKVVQLSSVDFNLTMLKARVMPSKHAGLDREFNHLAVGECWRRRDILFGFAISCPFVDSDDASA